LFFYYISLSFLLFYKIQNRIGNDCYLDDDIEELGENGGRKDGDEKGAENIGGF